MNKAIVLILMGLSLFPTASAQNAADSVKSAIQQMFEGMREADSAAVSQVFAPEARMLTVVENEGKAQLREGSLAQFLEAIGTPHEEIWDERISRYQIHVDGRMATAWTPYRFYRDSRFSHCGVNAFQLYQSEEGWKIIQVTDTRRPDHCPE